MELDDNNQCTKKNDVSLKFNVDIVKILMIEKVHRGIQKTPRTSQVCLSNVAYASCVINFQKDIAD